MLDRVGYSKRTSTDKIGLTLRQALASSTLTVRQAEAVRGMIARVQWALDHPTPPTDPR